MDKRTLQRTVRDSVYIAGLLFKIGEFIERAQLSDWKQLADECLNGIDSLSMPDYIRYSAAFVQKFRDEKTFLSDTVESLIVSPYQGLTSNDADRGYTVSKLLALADFCTATESNEASNSDPSESYLTRLQSPFSDIQLKSGQTEIKAKHRTYLNARPLSTMREAGFPQVTERTFLQNPYSNQVKAFLTEFNAVDNESELFALMERHLHWVPVQSTTLTDPYPRISQSSVSLFDHSRTVAAIALCLIDEYEQGSWHGLDQKIQGLHYRELPPPSLLISGDLSGIQRFIFDVPSDGAARTLKGRSLAIQLYADAAIRFITDRFNLKAASVLYNGGGNFFLLIPAYCESDLVEVRQILSKYFLQNNLYLSLGWTPVSIDDFRNNFAECWGKVHKSVETQKQRRYQELGVDIFTPFSQPSPSRIEDLRKVYQTHTQELNNAQGYQFVQMNAPLDQDSPELYQALGYSVELYTEPNRDAIAYNTTEIFGKWKGFRFLVKDLPRYDRAIIKTLQDKLYNESPLPAEMREGTIIDFDHLAKLAALRTGTDKLGILKIDVDNLGHLLAHGLPAKSHTIARVAGLSRAVKWFFEGYLQDLIQKSTFTWITQDSKVQESFHQQLYPIFSGGDDVFLVGAWDAVFEFAWLVQTEFKQFVQHPGITLSASLLIVDPSFSVSRFSELAESRLEHAKHAHIEKSRINVFDITLTWEEFEEARNLKDQLEVLVKQRGESRALIQRVERSAIGYDRLQEEAVRGRIRPEKIWRLNYFLVRNARKENLESIRQLAETHDRMLREVFLHAEQARNPALFTVASRWAELSSRQESSTVSPS